MFNTDGTFVRRLATGGTLNSPWGLVAVREEFGGSVQSGTGHGEYRRDESGVNLFFTAGPNGETGGLFGSLTATLTS